jgi:hypothetical protein
MTAVTAMMAEGLPAPLAAWESFYVIVGTSAAALTGLMFVVIALVADIETRASEPTISAFGTPTIVHFCATLLISAVVSAPWPGLGGADLALGIMGAAGLAYTGVVIARARRQTGYEPVFEDWLWHAILPLAAYGALAAAAVAMWRGTTAALFAVGAAAVLLVFIGIHNAWDTVTYLALRRVRQREAGAEPGASPNGSGGAAPRGSAASPGSPGAHQGGGGRGRRRHGR